jgi:hypothetical protein
MEKKASTRKLKQLSEHGKQTEEQLEYAVAEARMLETNLKLVKKANKSGHTKELTQELHELEQDKWEMAEEIDLLRQEKADMAEDLYTSMQTTEIMRSNLESVSSGAVQHPIGFITLSDTMSVDDSTIAQSFAPERHAAAAPPAPPRRMAYHSEVPESEETGDRLRSSRHSKQHCNGSEARSSSKKSRSRSSDRRAIADPYSEGQSKTSDRRARSKERFLSHSQHTPITSHGSSDRSKDGSNLERGLPRNSDHAGHVPDRRSRSKERFPESHGSLDRSNAGSNLPRNSDHAGHAPADRRSGSKERFPERTISRANSQERFHSKPMPKFESDRADDGFSARTPLSRNSSHSAKKPLRRAKSNEGLVRVVRGTFPERTNSSDQIPRHSDRSPRIPERGLTRGMSERIYSQPIDTLKGSERRVPERGISRTSSERFPREEREIPHIRSIKRAKSGEKLRKAERY